MKNILTFLLTIAVCFLLYTQFLTLQCLMWVSDRAQFLIVDREINAAQNMLEMFKDNKKISKEEMDEMKDRYINAMREFEKVSHLTEKYPKRPELKQLKALTRPFFGIPIQDRPINPDFEETLKRIREDL